MKTPENTGTEKLREFLKSLPHLALSKTGISNVASRFKCSTAAVLDTIRAIEVERLNAQKGAPHV